MPSCTSILIPLTGTLTLCYNITLFSLAPCNRVLNIRNECKLSSKYYNIKYPANGQSGAMFQYYFIIFYSSYNCMRSLNSFTILKSYFYFFIEHYPQFNGLLYPPQSFFNIGFTGQHLSFRKFQACNLFFIN